MKQIKLVVIATVTLLSIPYSRGHELLLDSPFNTVSIPFLASSSTAPFCPQPTISRNPQYPDSIVREKGIHLIIHTSLDFSRCTNLLRKFLGEIYWYAYQLADRTVFLDH